MRRIIPTTCAFHKSLSPFREMHLNFRSVLAQERSGRLFWSGVC